MPRLLFEFEDLSWFPDTIRRSMVDYLSFFLNAVGYYKPATALIAECLQHTSDKAIVDLCSGGGGPILQLQKHLNEAMGAGIPITLTDRFPNVDAYENMAIISGRNISYEAAPVDAINVPKHLNGVRTCFSAIHHFDESMVKCVLEDAVSNNVPVAIFDGGDKNMLTALGIILVHPIVFFFCTPFFKPFRFSRLLFTYLIPVIPLCTVWDGVVSIARLYRPKKLKEIAEKVSREYKWQAGTLRHPLGFGISYLTGYPR